MEKKLTKKELQQLKDFKTTYDQIVNNIGLLEVRKSRLKADLSILERDNFEFGQELFKKYGEGERDVEKGKIISSQ